jgi:hypothetical protein
MGILLAITFVFGTLRFLTLTKVFDTQLQGLFKSYVLNNKFWNILDVLIFHFSLVFQAYYWFFK